MALSKTKSIPAVDKDNCKSTMRSWHTKDLGAYTITYKVLILWLLRGAKSWKICKVVSRFSISSWITVGEVTVPAHENCHTNQWVLLSHISTGATGFKKKSCVAGHHRLTEGLCFTEINQGIICKNVMFYNFYHNESLHISKSWCDSGFRLTKKMF